MSDDEVSSNSSSISAITSNKRKKTKKTHKCPTCGLIVSSKSGLTQHLKTHTGSKPLECNDCGMTFSLKNNLKRHIIEVHTGQKQRTVVLKNCTICDKLVSTRQMFCHMNMHTKPYQCSHCGKALSSKSILAKHLLIHSDNREKPFECNDCGKTFAAKSTLKGHIMTVHSKDKLPKEKNCTVCDKLISVRAMDTHMRIHTRPFICNDCGKNFISKSQLQGHINTHHTEEALKKRSKCPVCEKMVINLSQHLKMHTGLRPFECPHCGKTFMTASNLNSHVKSVHKTREALKCDHCSRLFYTKNQLKSHMKVHTGEKPHQCTVCDMRFAHKGSLVIHMRKHSGERPYICSHCDRTFISSFVLTQHERSHNKENKFKCSTCSKAFSQYANMKRHMKNHQELWPYKCTKCPQAFKHLGYCKKHVATCRAKRRKRNSESDDDQVLNSNTVFRPAFEQFGPHQMKKCSVFIKRSGLIEDALLEGYLSIDVSVKKKPNGKQFRSIE